jgi:hypothetical protein
VLIRYDAALRRAWGFAAIQVSGKSSQSRSAGWVGIRSRMSLEVEERVDPVTLAAAHQAIQVRRRPAASITSNKHVVFSSDGLSTKTPFRDVVVDAQLAYRGGWEGKPA